MTLPEEYSNGIPICTFSGNWKNNSLFAEEKDFDLHLSLEQFHITQ